MLPGGLSSLGPPGFGRLVGSFAPGRGCCLGAEIGSCIGNLIASLWGLMSRKRWGESGEGPCVLSSGNTFPGSSPGWVECTNSLPSSCSKLLV